MKTLSKSELHKMGYRKISENRYGKKRKIRNGLHSVFIGVEHVNKFRWDVHAVEDDGSINWSTVETRKQLKDWESFAIPNPKNVSAKNL